MKPVAARPEKGGPPFQIAKGTRMHFLNGIWQDMTATDTGAQMERLEETALREGAEELGLDAACIVCLADLGESQMTSVQTGKPKRLHLFAAELSAEPLLLPHAPTTAACRWMTLTEFAAHGRPDHLPLVERALRRLA